MSLKPIISNYQPPIAPVTQLNQAHRAGAILHMFVQEALPKIEQLVKALLENGIALEQVQVKGRLVDKKGFSGSVVPYALFQKNRPETDVDFFICLEKRWKFVKKDVDRICKSVFEDYQPSPKKRDQESHYTQIKIPSYPLPIDLTLSSPSSHRPRAIESTSSYNSMRFIATDLTQEGFAVELMLSEKVEKYYNLRTTFTRSLAGLTSIHPDHAKHTRDGLINYVYGLTRGIYLEKEAEEIEKIFCETFVKTYRNGGSSKRYYIDLHRKLRGYVFKHFPLSGTPGAIDDTRRALCFLLNLADCIERSPFIDHENQQAIIQIIADYVRSAIFQRKVELGPSSDEEIEALFDETLAEKLVATREEKKRLARKQAKEEALELLDFARHYFAEVRQGSQRVDLARKDRVHIYEDQASRTYLYLKPPKSAEYAQKPYYADCYAFLNYLLPVDSQKNAAPPIQEEKNAPSEEPPPQIEQGQIARESLDDLTSLRGFIERWEALRASYNSRELVDKLIGLLSVKKGDALKPLSPVEVKTLLEQLPELLNKGALPAKKVMELIHLLWERAGNGWMEEKERLASRLISWFFARSDIASAQKIYDLVPAQNSAFIEQICSHLNFDRLKQDRAEKIAEWIIGGFGEDSSALIQRTTALLERFPELQCNLINGAYDRASPHEKVFLEERVLQIFREANGNDLLILHQEFKKSLALVSDRSYCEIFSLICRKEREVTRFFYQTFTRIEQMQLDEQARTLLSELHILFKERCMHPRILDRIGVLVEKGKSPPEALPEENLPPPAEKKSAEKNAAPSKKKGVDRFSQIGSPEGVLDAYQRFVRVNNRELNHWGANFEVAQAYLTLDAIEATNLAAHGLQHIVSEKHISAYYHLGLAIAQIHRSHEKGKLDKMALLWDRVVMLSFLRTEEHRYRREITYVYVQILKIYNNKPDHLYESLQELKAKLLH